ncbi:unnamed protein product [Trichobilharzia regenti]|nr:unnamed protein product [Trichobilharzia regenti]
MRHFRNVVEDYRKNVKDSCKEQGVEPSEWSFHSAWVFNRFDIFIERLEAIKIYYKTLMEYNRLEKVEVLGIGGQVFSSRVKNIYEEYLEAHRKFVDVSMDCLSPEDNTFMEMLNNFMELFEQMDYRLSTIFLKAYKLSGSTLGAFKVS